MLGIFIVCFLCFFANADSIYQRYDDFIAHIPSSGQTPLPPKLRRNLDSGYKYTFVGNALLGVYQVGALSRLFERNLIQRNSVMFGSSSGSITALNFCGGADIEAMKSQLRTLIQGCAPNPNLCVGTYLDHIALGMQITLPPGTPMTNCANLQISLVPATNVCTPSPYSPGIAGPGTLVGNFLDRDEGTAAALASSAIPFVTTFTCSRVFRGNNFIDGGFGGPSSNAPCPTADCIIISGQIEQNQIGYDATIYPGVSGSIRPGLNPTVFSQTFNATLVFQNFDELYEQGREDVNFYFDNLK